MLFSHQCSVASVSQRSDDQTWRVPQVLIGILHVTVNYANVNIFIAPVVTKLGQPLEVSIIRYTLKIKKNSLHQCATMFRANKSFHAISVPFSISSMTTSLA